MRERDYQSGLIKRLRKQYPGCIIMKNDPTYLQGVPDLTVLYGTKWAALEVKAREPVHANAFEPNQEWYIQTMNGMSFAACIYPENEKEVLRGLQQTFTT